MKPETITLATIAHGQAPVLFAEELERVLANIADEQTPATAVRRITLEIAFSPDALRHAIDVKIDATTRLAKINHESGTMYATLTDEGIKATVGDVKQPLLGEIPAKAKRGRLKVGETVSGGPKESDEWPSWSRPSKRSTAQVESQKRRREREAAAKADED